MHIHEAVLSGSPAGLAVLGAGIVATVVGTAIGLRRLHDEQLPRVAVVTAVFFVVSLIHVPLGITSAHLVLNGLVGLLLGWVAFPSLLVALLLQALLFGHGGLLALGINTLTMALPAVICYYVCGSWVAGLPRGRAIAAAFLAGALGVLGGAVLTAGALWIAGEEFTLLARAVVAFHLVLAVVEGLVTGSVVLFIRQVRPELFALALHAPAYR